MYSWLYRYISSIEEWQLLFEQYIQQRKNIFYSEIPKKDT